MSDLIVGIDLGTTNSEVAAFVDGEVKVLGTGGRQILPSCVGFSASGQKIFRITEGIVVEGKIQKPNAFYVLQRSGMDYDWESLKQDFLPKILQAASHHPF